MLDELPELPPPTIERVPPPPALRPIDTLGERSAVTRRLGEIPTIAKLTRHAERFGGEQVVETAVELGYNLDTCVRLCDAVDRIDAARHRELFPKRPFPKRGAAEARVRALMGLEKEDLATAA